jgi:uncharacterized protein (DUF2236 family)
LNDPLSMLRGTLMGRVQSVFNDRGRGETPVVRSARALYPPHSVIWRVHADVTTMMVGGVSALLLQMLHPAALTGIWDHSNFRHDMLGRLRRTARFIAETTYAEAGLAESAIARVIEVHSHVTGTLPDGRVYSANDPDLLAWVHVAEAWSFLEAWKRYGEPGMSHADQDTYFAEAALVAKALGAVNVPMNRTEAEAMIAQFRPSLVITPVTRQVAQLVLRQPAPNLSAAPAQALIMQAAVDLLPDWAKNMHGFRLSPINRTATRAATLSLAKTLRWAFADARKQIVPE